MARIVLLSMVLALAACAEESDPVGMVRSARLAPDTGKTVETALSAYNLFKDPVWETYVDADGRTVVRFVAEYDVSRGVADCPPVGPEVRPAARVFVTLRYLLEGGVVSLADGFIEAYSTTGYSARYLPSQGPWTASMPGSPAWASWFCTFPPRSESSGRLCPFFSPGFSCITKDAARWFHGHYVITKPAWWC